MIGFDQHGSGTHAVIVLNDWLCDTSTWDGTRAYLDTAAFRWIFADLRGYGRSRGMPGQHNAVEAAADVLALADSLGLSRFSLVAHSMSTLVVMEVLRTQQARIDGAVLLTPPPPTGMGLDAGILNFLKGMALGDDAARHAGLTRNATSRLSPQWLAWKIARWRATADSDAVADYVDMFGAAHGAAPRVTVPLLVVTGECDAEPMRSAPVRALFSPLCEQLEVQALAECGHYPMQEAPPLLTTIVQRFLIGQPILSKAE